jgi:polyribonucleotide nucleotidyltransferase
MNKTSVSAEIAGKTLTFETGELATQATSSVLARIGDTVVLVTVVEGGKTELDYFPLSVDYVERLYAGGKIKGSRWVKREGRPSDEAILAGRLIDRSIRPLFPKEFKNEVQVIITILSVDGENDPDILAINGVSAAIAMSRIPWNGPIGAVRMGYIKENGDAAEILTNPTASEMEVSQLDIVVSQSKDKTVMIEAGAKQVKEEVLVSSIGKAHAETQKVIKAIEELVKKAGAKKLEVVKDAAVFALIAIIEKSYKEEVQNLISGRVNREAGGDDMEELVNKIFDDQKMAKPDEEVDKKVIVQAIEKAMFKLIRKDVVEKQKRADGRKLDEIRAIACSTSILPRTHGSALFQRGITQALSIVTLGSPRMEQLIESAEGEEIKRYIHHYSGLPYSFGQTGRVGTPSRREIGHGALAERALEAVIPSQDVFPYTIRVVSEVLSQNGSSSMASTCGSTLALMDAGVPIIKPVAGISIGMMSNEEKYELLTDIIGLEDFSGDMDFKVAGTDEGVTAIQLDVKIPGLTDEQIVNIFERAKIARLQILDTMLKSLPKTRTSLSQYAPKISMVKIPVEKIGEVIGPGGKVIKNIIATTGATVDVEDDGSVAISGTDEEAVKKAVDWVTGLVREVQPGEVFEGEVKRILPFGAFVEVLPGKEGMVHVSKMAAEFVNDPNEVVQIGQKVKVRVVEIDDQGRINLSMLFGEEAESKDRQPREPRPATGGGFRDRRPQGVQSEHPLAMQFRRERRVEGAGDWRTRSTTSRPASRPGFSRDRKPRY